MEKRRMILTPEFLLDGSGEAARQEMAIVVDDGRIEAVISVQALPAETDAQLIRLDGMTLMPGLIDAHVHLTLGDGTTPRQTMMRESNEMLLLRAARQAREGLEAGVTTMRDCGGRDDVMFVLREGIEKGVIQGPRLLLSGRPITTARGHCYFMHGEVSDRFDMSRLIAALAGKGADFIKVMANGGGLTPGTNSLELQFSQEDLAYMVTEAGRYNLPVAAHVHSLAGIETAVTAGVSSLEHCTCIYPGGIAIERPLIERIAAEKVIVVPTAIPAEKAVRAGRKLGVAREIGISTEEFLAGRNAVLQAMFASGVRLLAGSDAGATGVQFDDVTGEIGLFATAGMSNAQAIAAATGLSATSLGLPDLGYILPGYHADLLAVYGNAGTDLAALHSTAIVMRGGRIVHTNNLPEAISRAVEG